jgi:two-component system CheB/CheR fusion protein
MRLKDLPQSRRDRARDMIERQINHLVRLIDDLLDVSRITRGLITLQPKLVELGPIVSHAIETARAAMDARQQEMASELPREPVYVEADATRLAQAIGNVLHNAAKFTPDGGQIRLRVSVEAGQATIRVRDTGVGIPAAELPRIFDLFARGDYEAPATQPGLGIGLSLVRRFMEMHGGAAEAASDGPGKGSEFTLRLPVAHEPQAIETRSRAGAATPPVTAAPRRILVVDDNQDAAEAISLLLRLAGHETRVEHDGLRALDAASEFQPDVVLLDLRMPNLDGFETARRLRQRPNGGGLTLVALSGWSGDRHRRESHKAGFNAHLVKPVDQTELLRVVGELSGHARNARRPVTS